MSRRPRCRGDEGFDKGRIHDIADEKTLECWYLKEEEGRQIQVVALEGKKVDVA